MDNVLIAYIALIIGICVGTIFCIAVFKISNIVPKTKNQNDMYKYKEKDKDDNKIITQDDNDESGTVSLFEKIPDKSFTFTDINCAADEIDPDEFIKQMRSREDSAYTSLKNKIDKANVSENKDEQAIKQ